MAPASRYRLDHLVGFYLVLVLLVIAVDEVFSLPLVRPVIVFLFIAFVPGLLIVTLLGGEPQVNLTLAPYYLGLSLLFVLVAGFGLNLISFVVGYRSPLSLIPLTVTVTLLVLALLVAVRRSEELPTFALPTRESLKLPESSPLFFLSLPFLSVLGMTYLNTVDQTIPITFVLSIIAIVPLLAVAGFIGSRYYPLAIWTTSLAILYHKSLWKGFAYDGHTAVVTIWETKFWDFAGESLATNTIMMPSFARLLGVNILTQLKVVMPLFVAFLPVGMFLTFRQYARPRSAFLGTCIFILAHPFYYQYPSTPRASMPVLFLVLLSLTISDDSWSRLHKTIMSMAFGIGIIVSHYGTSYYVLFALLGAVGLLFTYNIVDDILENVIPYESGLNRGQLDSAIHGSYSEGVLGWTFATFYLVGILSWYIFIDQATKFEGLVKHILNAYMSIFVNRGGQGKTATRLATDYGATSIQFSKYIYVVLAGLAGIGILVVCLRRFVPMLTTEFDDEYLALTTMLFVLFGGTFIFSGEWGGGRPMMITMSHTAIFIIVAIQSIGALLKSIVEDVIQRLGDDWMKFDGLHSVDATRSAFAVLLAIFFVLNSGVGATVVWGGEAPSNVPNTDPDSMYLETDLQTHVWLTDHRIETVQITGDRRVREQATDWMPGEIAVRSRNYPYRFKKPHELARLSDPSQRSGYFVLVGHNVVEKQIDVNYVTRRPLSDFDLMLHDRNKVYTNGQGEVYYRRPK